jgi:hypothetical protein
MINVSGCKALRVDLQHETGHEIVLTQSRIDPDPTLAENFEPYTRVGMRLTQAHKEGYIRQLFSAVNLCP